MKNLRYYFFSSLLLIFLLSACNLPEKAADADNNGDLLLTAAAETVAVALTQADADNGGSQENTPEPVATTENVTVETNTPVSTNTLVPANAPTSSQACNAATYIKDVTIPDNTDMTPGETFTKTWEIKNIGSCTWTTSYSLIYAAEISGTAKLNEPASVNLSKSVAPGETIEISVALTAAATAGEYRSDWLMRSDTGITFNIDVRSIWLVIDVVEPAASATAQVTATPGGPTVTPEPTATTAPTIYASTSSEGIAQTNSINFDSGNVGTSGADLFFAYGSDDDKSIKPQNGASFLLWGLGEPDYADCLNAVMNTNSIKVDSDLPGQYVCYETEEGRTGYFYVQSLSPSDKSEIQVLDLMFITWAIP